MSDQTTQAIRAAASQVDRHPTPGQIEAGNYRKGHFAWNGMHLVIENPRGSVRSGTDPNGKTWRTEMAHHYGYVRSSEGADGDPVDIFMGHNPHSRRVWVIDQVDPATREFDEHKCLLGFDSRHEAVAGYLACYEPGWQGIGAVSEEMTPEDFRDWVTSGEALTAMSLPPDAPEVMQGQPIITTFRGRVIPFRAIGWDDHPRPLLKAEGGSGAIPPGAHWLTVHPNGPGTKGHPVLVMPVAGHKGVGRIIGGAQGKLNGLRLQGLKDPAQYKQEQKARRQDAQAKERERKTALSPEERAQEKQDAATRKGQRREAEEEFIRRVLGQTGEAQSLFTDGESPETPSESHGDRLKRAKAIAKEAERRVMLDAESRVAAGIGQVGGANSIINVHDILQESTATGPGYRRELAARAAEHGLTAERLAQKVAEIRGIPQEEREETGRPTPVPTDEEAEANREAHKDVKVLEAGRTAAMREAVKQALDQHGDLAQILKARAVMREAVLATRKDTSPTYEPGFQMATTEEAEPDTSLVDDLQQKMLTQHVVAFLEEVGDHYPADEVPDPFGVPPEGGAAAARGAGAFDALHEMGLAAIGQGVIDRDTVEALGPEHSALIVARAMRHEFTPEDQEQILAALEHHHLQHQEQTLPAVTAEAQRLKAAADQMGADIAATPRDFALAVEMQKAKVAALKEARSILGAELGRLETRAALIAALRQPPQADLTIPLGKMSPEKAVQTAAALGLQDGDYEIEHDAGEAILTLHETGQDRLIRPVDQGALAERQIALSLKSGQQDEDGWRPKGFADRSATRYDNPLQEPMQFRREMPPITPDNVEGAVQDYVGAMLADGHDPLDILADLHSGARKSQMDPAAREAYEQHLASAFPIRTTDKDAQGNPIPERDSQTGEVIRDLAGEPLYKTRVRKPSEVLEAMQPALHNYLRTSGEANLTLEGQTVPPDKDFHEAIHRAMAQDPRAAAAFAPPGELDHEAAGHVRDYFYRTYHDGAKNTGEAKQAKLHQALEALGPEPPKANPDTAGMQMSPLDMLGEEDAGDAASVGNNPAWEEWNAKRNTLLQEHQTNAEAISGEESPWATYVKRMGGLKNAQKAIQDEMRGQFSERFHEHYKNLTGRTLHMATKEQHHASLHLSSALGGEAAAAYDRDRKSKQATIQNRGGQGFQSGSVADYVAQGAAANRMQQAEASLFGMDDLDSGAQEEGQPWQKPERQQGERYTLGGAMENLLRAHVGAHAGTFAGRRDGVQIREGMHMSGDYVAQQRCVKGILQLKRIGLFQGAGSGKTSIMQGALSQLHAEGKLKGKAILSVPSVVQGQFGAEAIQFLDPTSGFNIHAQPGESWEQRLRAYQDPDKHAVVVTHQTLRDDSIRMLAAHLDMSTAEATEHLMSLPKKQAALAIKDAMWAHGVNVHAFMADESHNALDRDGKEDSVLSRVFDAHSHNAEYVVQATGDPLKNDISEVWSDLNKIDPHRWHDGTKAEFMRRYGANAQLAKRSLAQELTRYWFNGKIAPPVTAHKRHENIPLTEGQQARMREVETASGKLQTGTGDIVAAAKALAPEAFRGKPDDQHQAIAESVRKAVGTYRENAFNRVINLDPEGGKIQHHVQVAKDRVAEGKPVVIFAKNLEAVDAIHAAMEKAGLKSVSLTGRDSSKDKGIKAGKFQKGEAQVIVMSDAGATGLNLQQGKVLIQHDFPATAMTSNQRNARIHRLGQKDDVEIIHAMADHPWERQNQERVKRKDLLGGIFQSPEGYLDDSGVANTLRELRERRAQQKGTAA